METENHFCISVGVLQTRMCIHRAKIQSKIALFRFSFTLTVKRKKEGKEEERERETDHFTRYFYSSVRITKREREDRSLSRDGGRRSSKGSFLLLSSLAKLTTGTKCVTTIPVVYLFLPGVTLILINLSFLQGR